MRPREFFALDQSIQELRLIARGSVLRAIQIGLSALPGQVALRDLSAVDGNGGVIALRREPTGDGNRHQGHGKNGRSRHTRTPAQPELARVFVGMGREVDVKTHKNSYQYLVPSTQLADSPPGCSYWQLGTGNWVLV